MSSEGRRRREERKRKKQIVLLECCVYIFEKLFHHFLFGIRATSSELDGVRGSPSHPPPRRLFHRFRQDGFVGAPSPPIQSLSNGNSFICRSEQSRGRPVDIPLRRSTSLPLKEFLCGGVTAWEVYLWFLLTFAKD